MEDKNTTKLMKNYSMIAIPCYCPIKLMSLLVLYGLNHILHVWPCNLSKDVSCYRVSVV